MRKLKRIMFKVKWFFNPYRYFAQRKNLNGLAVDVSINRKLLENNRHQTIEHMKAIHSIKSNISAYKKTVGEKFDVSTEMLLELKQMLEELHVDVSRTEKKCDQYLNVVKEMDKKLKTFHNKLDRIFKIEDEIDMLDDKRKENQKILEKTEDTIRKMQMDLTGMENKFAEAMGIQGRQAVYQLQERKNHFIQEFKAIVNTELRHIHGNGRAREIDSAEAQE